MWQSNFPTKSHQPMTQHCFRLSPHPWKAKRLLGWTPKHTITDDLGEYFEGYKAAGKLETEPDMTKVGSITQLTRLALRNSNSRILV